MDALSSSFTNPVDREIQPFESNTLPVSFLTRDAEKPIEEESRLQTSGVRN